MDQQGDMKDLPRDMSGKIEADSIPLPRKRSIAYYGRRCSKSCDAFVDEFSAESLGHIPTSMP